MTTPIGPPNKAALAQLISQYGNIYQIPQQLLAQAGYTPGSAAVENMSSGGLVRNITMNVPTAGGPFNGGAVQPVNQTGVNLGRSLTGGRLGQPVGGYGNPDLAPQPGGINYGTPANGSYRGLPSVGVNSATDTRGGNPDLAPVAGGVNYGTPANGSLEGLPSVGTNSAPIDSRSGADSPWNDVPWNDMPGQDVNYPTIPQYQFTLKDFTDQANQMAAAAYSPQYAAVTSGEKQAKDNNALAQAMVKGLYDDLVSDTTADTKKYDTQAQADINAAKATGVTNANAAKGMYDKSQTDLANQLKALGIQAAAPDVLQNGASDSAFAQSQATARAQEQADYLNKIKGNMDVYQTQLGSAEQSTGVANQEELANQLANTLNEWEGQRLGLTSQQSQYGQQLANDLRNQDLQLQQLNYGVGQDQFNNQMTVLGAQQQAAAQATSAASAQAAALLDKQKFLHQIDMDSKSMDLEQAKLEMQKYGIDTTNITNQAQLQATIDAQNAQTIIDLYKAQHPTTSSSDSPTGPMGDWQTQVGNIGQQAGIDPDSLVSIVMAEVQQNPTPRSSQEFINQVAQAAEQALGPGSANAAQQAAAAYYWSVMGGGYPAGGKSGTAGTGG